MSLSFTIHAHDGAARLGTLQTAHGEVQTPAFMPVGTAATVKAMTPEMVAETGADIILGNTYHLMLRPGAERVASLGGLHRFMHWEKPILTDSGGFQVMSLSGLRKLDEDGVTFRSHVDGSKHRLTPERSVEIQHLLDSNITIVFDECPPYPIEKDKAASSMRLSMRWAQRCRDAFVDRPGYGVFGIVQGSVFADLRQESIAVLESIDFDGYAIGGLAVGEGQDAMFAVLDAIAPHMPEDRPRYLMGVGRPQDIVGAVLRGVDMFDCVLPTRSGRNAKAYTFDGEINLRNAAHASADIPLDPDCPCMTCRNYSRAYLHHLIRCGEMLGGILLTYHNLFHYQTLMQRLRTAIGEGRLTTVAAMLLQRYDAAEKPASMD